MKVLIVGSGGREHALAWQCSQFDEVRHVYVAPGNAGTALENKISNIGIDSEDIVELISFAQDESIDITIVGPEAPLVMGIVDDFLDQGLAIFGPTKKASQLEGSKAFCKDFLERNNIPTAYFEVFTEAHSAIEYVKGKEPPIVIKADGLAAGKGVIIANTFKEATHAINDMLEENRFGEAGSRVIIEEYLVGEEASFIVMVDGSNILPMATSQDHKARDNGDKGPNTGGMGAYSPAPIVTSFVFEKAMDKIIKPTVDAMINEGMPYTGFLYAGLMIDSNGEVKVLEYNCRFGDPETQPIMMRLKSNLAKLCLSASNGSLRDAEVEWDDRTSLGVVMAANGYPESYQKGGIISLPKASSTSKVFHAGTKLENNKILSNGGRVLCATSLGVDLKDAQEKAYELVNEIKWKGSYFRTDIGFKGLKNKE
ncbi:MAG: phosphoribosylamine--glycine ligase [Pseudomonadota bacterium]|nr:phosphoribosylamine--glycine ligase [Pseudomonadota bacterium]